MKITFSTKAWKEYTGWQRKEYLKTLSRINDLIEDIKRNGAARGIGKPERLRWATGWSRRIDDMHRLVYEENAEGIEILSCYGHYE